MYFFFLYLEINYTLILSPKMIQLIFQQPEKDAETIEDEEINEVENEENQEKKKVKHKNLFKILLGMNLTIPLHVDYQNVKSFDIF